MPYDKVSCRCLEASNCDAVASLRSTLDKRSHGVPKSRQDGLCLFLRRCLLRNCCQVHDRPTSRSTDISHACREAVGPIGTAHAECGNRPRIVSPCRDAFAPFHCGPLRTHRCSPLSGKRDPSHRWPFVHKQCKVPVHNSGTRLLRTSICLASPQEPGTCECGRWDLWHLPLEIDTSTIGLVLDRLLPRGPSAQVVVWRPTCQMQRSSSSFHRLRVPM